MIVERPNRIALHNTDSGRTVGYAHPVTSHIDGDWLVVHRTPDAPNWLGATHEVVPDRAAALARLRELDGAR